MARSCLYEHMGRKGHVKSREVNVLFFYQGKRKRAILLREGADRDRFSSPNNGGFCTFAP